MIDKPRERLKELLTQRVTSSAEAASGADLIQLAEGMTGPPLVCILEGGAGLLAFRRLSERLPGRAVYALRLHPIPQESETFQSIQEIAACFMQVIQGQLAGSSLVVCGHSLGGTLAYELAQQWMRAGETVASVVIIDQPGPDVKISWVDWWYWQWAAIAHLSWRTRWNYLVESLGYRLRTNRWMPSVVREIFFSRRWRHPSSERSPRMAANVYRRKLTDSRIAALRAYQPEPLDCPCVLIRAKSGAPRMHADPYGGWGRLTGQRIHVHEVVGTHMTMFEGEQLEAVAAVLELALIAP